MVTVVRAFIYWWTQKPKHFTFLLKNLGRRQNYFESTARLVDFVSDAAAVDHHPVIRVHQWQVSLFQMLCRYLQRIIRMSSGHPLPWSWSSSWPSSYLSPYNVPELTVNGHYDESENVFVISRCVVTTGSREKARVFKTLNFFKKAWHKLDSCSKTWEADNCWPIRAECAQQSIECAPAGSKALPTEALVHSP